MHGWTNQCNIPCNMLHDPTLCHDKEPGPILNKIPATYCQTIAHNYAATRTIDLILIKLHANFFNAFQRHPSGCPNPCTIVECNNQLHDVALVWPGLKLIYMYACVCVCVCLCLCLCLCSCWCWCLCLCLCLCLCSCSCSSACAYALICA